MSVDLGQTESFKIDTDAKAYTIDIYRLGYYQGDGARLIASIKPSAALPQTQPACISDPTTYDYDCGDWGISASWTVPTSVISGVYIATLTRTDTGGQSQIPFVVRDDSSHADIVYQTSDPTWEAYNTYGGSDFYTGGGDIGRAYKISYNRPFATRGDNQGRDYLFSNEYPAIRFLEENGYDVTYISGVDTDRYGATLLTNHKLFVSVGHDEYWSVAQRANVEAARDAGVNLAFFSGNEVYWRTRWENSIDGSNTPYRTLVSYKETWSNAPVDPEEPAQDTATWRDPRFGQPAQPENGLTGTIYMSNTGGFAIQVPYAYSKDRLWRNTSVANLTAGQTATLGSDTLGYEWDSDLDNGARPAGLIDLSSTTEQVDQKLLDYGNTVAQGTVTHSLTLYRAASGALVFGAGTVQWAWGLDADHDGTGGTVNSAMQQATINLFADMGIQPQTLMSGMVPAIQSTDKTPPVPVISSPTASSKPTVATSFTVSGTATDAGGTVAGVEVSVDGGQTWHPATGTNSWSYAWTPTVSGQVKIEARATDDSANISAPVAITVSVLARGCPCSIWPSTAAPAPIPLASVTAGEGSGGIADGNDPSPTQVGIKFQSSENGYITGVRFYKASGNTGTHTGSLWSATGQLLATATFSNETATGWQEVDFDTAVPVTAGTTYVASYYAPNGHYSGDSFFFETSGLTNEPLTALSNSAGGNGVYYYGADGVFPSDTYDATNYWVDPVFVSANPGPSVVSATPQPTPEGVSTTVAAVSATFDQAVTPSSATISVTQPGMTILGTNSYNSTTKTASFAPSSALSPGTTYTVVVHATSASTGAQMLPYTWSFTTAASAAPCPCTLWPSGSAPSSPESDDTNATDLGVKFTPTVGGVITGIRFYKDTANTGTHIGSLWSSSGQLLASATFANETAAGWQSVSFSAPVSVTAGTTYVASYFAPKGGYTATGGYFVSDGPAVGPLTTPTDAAAGGNGVYAYSSGSAFPSFSYGATNYWVDVTFAASGSGGTGSTGGTGAPSVVSSTPQPTSGGVPVTADITATFDQAVTPASTTVTLTQPGLTIQGATSYDSGTKTVTFAPGGSLSPGTTYTVTVNAVSAATGAAMQAYTWTFVTSTSGAPCPCTLWPASSAPMSSSSGDTNAVDLGVKFQPTSSGYVTGVRFYKNSTNTGTHVGSLWSATGTLLATATFASETTSGWQSVTFATPVAVTAGTTYIASYFAPNGNYTATSNYFVADGPAVGPLTTPSDAVSGGNGVYAYSSANAYPSYTFGATNYWVDVSFTTASLAPSVVSVTPVSGATGVQPTDPISATFGQAVDPASVGLSVTTGGARVEGTVTFDSSSRTVAFTPTVPMPAGATFDATVTASSAGNDVAMQPFSWSFATAGASGGCPCSLWPGGVAPTTPSVADSLPVELGMKFQPTTNGYVTGVRFYKGSGNGGTHTGSLWTISGQRLATATFTGESDIGWQSVTFDSPVAVTSGSTYIVSYFAPDGHYAATSGYFASSYVSGPLTAPSSAAVGGNGLYHYGAGGVVPDASFGATNYWVDVTFTTTVSCPCSLWPSSAMPIETAVADPSSVELGLRFQSSENGEVTGVRFYKDPKNGGTHTGSLWSASGDLLATTTFANETASGWQTATFGTPVAINAGTTYVVSYYAPDGFYAADPSYFALSDFTSGPLTALASTDTSGNGVYHYGSGGVLPTDSYASTNYWVDVIFTPS